MDLKCDWCEAENKIEVVVSSIKMGIVCSECGTKIGYIDYKDLNELIRECDYWKKNYLALKNNLTNKK